MRNLIILITTILATNFCIEKIYAQNVADLNLQKAATEGNVEDANKAIENGADINFLNRIKWTPMHTAIHNRKQNIIELLVEKGADINKKGPNGNTPLNFAVEKGFRSIVEYLITKGADINILNDDNQNALTIARNGGHNAIAELLIQHGATEPEVVEENNESTLETETQENQRAINNRRNMRAEIMGGRGQQRREEEIDLLADPNEIKARVETFEGLETAIKKEDSNSLSEMRKWKQIKNDNRTSLMRSIERQYEDEIKFIRKIAEEEKAENTIKAIDNMKKLRIEKFSKVNKELILQRREQREMERETQGLNTRGRAQTTGRETRRRSMRRGPAAGTEMGGATYARIPTEAARRDGIQEEEPNLLEIETQEEIDLWLDSDVDNKETLAQSVYAKILTEYRKVREVAVEEEAKKTTAAIDGLLLARRERLNAIVLQITQEREDLAQLEARRAEEEALGRGRRGRGTMETGRTPQQNQTRGRVRRR